MWFGGEDDDYGSQLGLKASDTTQLVMDWMEYLRNATGSAWQVAHPVVTTLCAVDLAFDPTVCAAGAWPNYYSGIGVPDELLRQQHDEPADCAPLTSRRHP